MKVKIAKWGNSLGLRLPKAAVEATGVSKPGVEVDVTIEGRDLRVRSLLPTKHLIRLEDLLAEMDRLGPENRAGDRSTGDQIEARRSSMMRTRAERSQLEDHFDRHSQKARMLPDIGDIAWIEFDPVKGTEQAGRRPGLNRDFSRRPPAISSSRCLSHQFAAKRPWRVQCAASDQALKTEAPYCVDQIRAIERAERDVRHHRTRPGYELLSEVRGRLAVHSRI